MKSTLCLVVICLLFVKIIDAMQLEVAQFKQKYHVDFYLSKVEMNLNIPPAGDDTLATGNPTGINPRVKIIITGSHPGVEIIHTIATAEIKNHRSQLVKRVDLMRMGEDRYFYTYLKANLQDTLYQIIFNIHIVARTGGSVIDETDFKINHMMGINYRSGLWTTDRHGLYKEVENGHFADPSSLSPNIFFINWDNAGDVTCTGEPITFFKLGSDPRNPIPMEFGSALVSWPATGGIIKSGENAITRCDLTTGSLGAFVKFNFRKNYFIIPIMPIGRYGSTNFSIQQVGQPGPFVCSWQQSVSPIVQLQRSPINLRICNNSANALTIKIEVPKIVKTASEDISGLFDGFFELSGPGVATPYTLKQGETSEFTLVPKASGQNFVLILDEMKKVNMAIPISINF
jgi:hypothetical protein